MERTGKKIKTLGLLFDLAGISKDPAVTLELINPIKENTRSVSLTEVPRCSTDDDLGDIPDETDMGTSTTDSPFECHDLTIIKKRTSRSLEGIPDSSGTEDAGSTPFPMETPRMGKRTRKEAKMFNSTEENRTDKKKKAGKDDTIYIMDSNEEAEGANI